MAKIAAHTLLTIALKHKIIQSEHTLALGDVMRMLLDARWKSAPNHSHSLGIPATGK
jgi:hypothetical protein